MRLRLLGIVVTGVACTGVQAFAREPESDRGDAPPSPTSAPSAEPATPEDGEPPQGPPARPEDGSAPRSSGWYVSGETPLSSGWGVSAETRGSSGWYVSAEMRGSSGWYVSAEMPPSSGWGVSAETRGSSGSYASAEMRGSSGSDVSAETSRSGASDDSAETRGSNGGSDDPVETPGSTRSDESAEPQGTPSGDSTETRRATGSDDSAETLHSGSANVSPARSSATPDVSSSSPPEWGVEGPYQLDVGAAVAAGARLDDPPRFRVTSRGMIGFEATLGIWLSRRLEIALHYERAAFGAEDSGLLPNGHVRLSRLFDALFATLRLDPLKGETLAGYVRLGPAVVWQHVDVEGAVWDPVTPAERFPVQCSGTGVGFGLRAAVGLDARLHEGLRIAAEGGVDNLRLGDGVLGGCGPGAGTTTLLGARAGFVYGFGL